MGSLPQGREPIDNNVLKIMAELTEAVMSRDIDRINEMSAAYVAALKDSKSKKENV